jgi:hypothetical protein
MAARSIHVTDLRELIRLLRKGEADRRIARDLGLSRNTVAKYRSWAGTSSSARRYRPRPTSTANCKRCGGGRAARTSSVEPFRERCGRSSPQAGAGRVADPHRAA